MTNEEVQLVVMTVCELLDKSVTPKEIDKAHEKAKKRLENFLHPKGPREPIVSRVRDRE